MADNKQVLVLEFNHAPAGLKLQEIKDIGIRDGINVSQSRYFSQEQLLPIINIENSFKPRQHREEQASKTLVIKIAGKASAVITF